jgi:hypothetical protein
LGEGWGEGLILARSPMAAGGWPLAPGMLGREIVT